MANPILEAFQWGAGGAKLTPEQVARQREVAAALMQKGDPAFHNAGWLGAIGRGLEGAYSGWTEGRANRAESEGRADLENKWNAYDWNSAFGGSPATSTAMATAPAPDYASARVAQAHNAGGATVPTGERAEYIRQGLLNRGLPGHVADAFLMNFQDESGLNPGINEVAPLVPGSRGGYGLYQLTGPRRREYEAFAADRGSPLDDIDAQLDFLMREGSGSERAAFERILAAPDTGTAASEIVNRFLRPAQAHRESRSARYSRAPNTAVGANEAMIAGSLAGVPVAETPQDILAQEAAMATQEPMAFQQPAAPLSEPRMINDMPVADIAQSLTRATVNPDLPMAGNTSGFLPVAQSLAAQPQQQGGMPNMQQLIELASDPWATDAQRGVVQALLQQQMQAQDPMRQAQLEKLRLETEALRNPAAPKPIEVGGVLLDPTTFQPIFDSRQNDGPASVQEYQFYANQMAALGQQPLPYDQWDIARRQSAATQVNVGSEGQRMGTIPAGMAAVPDPNNPSGFRLEAIPGGPAAIDEAAAAGQRDAQTVSDAQKAETTLDATRSVLDILDKADTPATGTLSRPFAAFSGTPAGRVRSYVGTLQSGVALGAMQRLKEASATGATGFGALSAPELNLLINDIGALDPDNTEPDIFRKTIERIQDRSRRVAEDIAKNVSPERIQELGLQGFIDAFSGGQPQSGNDGWRDMDGIKIRRKQ